MRAPLVLAAVLVVVGASGRSVPGVQGEELDRLRAENARLRQRLLSERARNRALESELARQGNQRLERELAWLDFHSQLSRLSSGASLAAELEEALGLVPAQEERRRQELRRQAEERLAEARARADRVRHGLNACLRVEGLDGFDLFEAGLLAADRPGGARSDGTDRDAAPGGEGAPDSDGGHAFGTGPVVVRLFDHRGVLAGSLVAERLHLEGSRSGHSVTLVLTDGERRERGVTTPFTDGVYRIPLRHVDPGPFLDACAELFDPGFVERRVDDGRWSRAATSLAVNRLLAASDGPLVHRLTFLGGVVGDELRDVEVTVSRSDGTELRRLVADALRIELLDDHVRLALEDGISVSSGGHAPFLDGRMRIVLVDAEPARWRAANVPTVELTDGRPAAEDGR